MEQPKTGNFIAFMNREKQPGDKQPAFDGRLSTPGAEDELRFALWAHEYTNSKTGAVQVMFNGQVGVVDAKASALDQVAALARAPSENGEAALSGLTLAPRQIVLFPNGFKDEAPEKDRPDYWGGFNPGNGEAVVRISVWAKKDRNQHAMLTGATSYPIPGKTEAQQQDATLETLLASGDLSKGMPKGKSKGGTGRA